MLRAILIILASTAWQLAFFLSIILMVAAMIQFTIEIQIANSALDVHLSDLEKHQEWQDYLATSKSRGKKITQSRTSAATNLG